MTALVLVAAAASHRALTPCRVSVAQINLLDGNDQNDAISPDMFVAFCRQHGFVVPALDD